MKEIFKALGNFQAKLQVIGFDKENPHFKNKYASLAAITKTIAPIMSEVGLSYTQLIQENKIITILFHIESGEQLQSEINLIQGKTAQQFGSDVTYMRRYSLLAMLGIVGDDDDDGNNGRKKQPQPFTEEDRKMWVESVKSAKTRDEAERYVTFVKLLHVERGISFEKLEASFKKHIDVLFPLEDNNVQDN